MYACIANQRMFMDFSVRASIVYSTMFVWLR
jgi:hypothetical protein